MEYKTEQKAAQDALEIFEGGACNPVAVSGCLHEAIRFYGQDGWDGCKSKPTLAMMWGHLGFLLGFGLGLPEGIDYQDTVKKVRDIAQGMPIK